MKNHNKAFTLIEVLIVTAVILLIASIINAQMGETRQKAEDAHMKTETQKERNAVEQYRQRTGSVPIPTGSYTAGSMVQEGTTQYRTAMQKLVDENLISSIPTSPSGQSYSYLATTDEQQAVFAAVLNNDSSSGSGGSSTNSCEVVDATVVYSNCQKDAFSCTETENIACFSSNISNNGVGCDSSTMVLDSCVAEAIGDTPQEICDAHWGNSNGTCALILLSTPWQCEKTVSGVCSGGSNSDYCSCI